MTIESAEEAVHLLTMENGLGYGPPLVHMRVRELKGAFDEDRVIHHTLSIRGLTQLVALRHVENDFKNFQTNLITLGSAAAMIARATAFALANELPTIVTGYSGYQRQFPEQVDGAVTWFEKMVAGYGLKLECPVRSFESERSVKDALLLYDVSGKSLERSSAFADSFSQATDEHITGYLEDKRPTLEAFIEKHRKRRSPGLAG